MSYLTPWSNRPTSFRIFDDTKSRSHRYTNQEIEAKFDAVFNLTDIEVSLLGCWSAIAYTPQKGSGNDSWGYKIFNYDDLQDCGLIDVRFSGDTSKVEIQEQRQVVDRLTDITQYVRRWGFVPRTYGTSLMRSRASK